MNTKIYNIYGLSRSGNHAIIFWIIHNLVESVNNIGSDIYIDKNKKLCFVNNVNIHNKLYDNIFSLYNFDYLIRSHEDLYSTDDTSIIILRDFLNLLCSRYKKYHNKKNNICYNNQYICDLHYLIQVWKQHCKSPKKYILYNKWLSSKQYRDKICSKLIEVNNNVDNIKTISTIGGSSLFNNKDYLKRYEYTNLPNHMKEIILKDVELLKLNQELFDIDIQEILNDSKSR